VQVEESPAPPYNAQNSVAKKEGDPRLMSLDDLLTKKTPTIRYKYNAGFTNAVRRSVRIGDFLK
jgi:hypothetical protein